MQHHQREKGKVSLPVSGRYHSEMGVVEPFSLVGSEMLFRTLMYKLQENIAGRFIKV